MRDQARPFSAGPALRGKGKLGLDDDGDSIVSAESLGPAKPVVKHAWATGSDKNVDKVSRAGYVL